MCNMLAKTQLSVQYNRFKTHGWIFGFMLVFATQCLAQNQNKHWFFGNRANIIFSGNQLQSTIQSAMTAIEGCATVSDPTTGSLLFYSNGLQIWNRNHVVMPNGDSLLGAENNSATQGVYILPYPGEPQKYYLFTTDETNQSGKNGLRYSVIDMNQDNGRGNIIAGKKNILLSNNSTERIIAAAKADGSGYWLISHERGNKNYNAFEVTNTGISSTPVISAVGSTHTVQSINNADGTMGQMKFNPSYTQLATALFGSNTIDVLRFNACDGKFDLPVAFTTADPPYGLEFSPDGSKLYYSGFNAASQVGVIYQTTVTQSNILLSNTPVGVSSSGNFQSIGSLQMGPDQKIYISINSEPWLSCISNPDVFGPACNFIDKVVSLPQKGLAPTTGIFGLPPFVLPYLNNSGNARIKAEGICVEDSVRFTLENIYQPRKIRWDFGDGTLQNADSSATLSHSYFKSGNYIVNVSFFNGCKQDTLSLPLGIIKCDTLEDECNLKIPNVFTPDRDGVNDAFYPAITCGFQEYHIYIFNIWGQEVFHESGRNDGWDGRIQGKDAADGTYFYEIEIISLKGIRTKYKGSLYLKR